MWFLAVPKLIIRSEKLSYCLSMTQPNIVMSLIEKEPMNTQVGLFLDKIGISVVILIRKTIAT